jgi:hypothetical protein
MNCHKNRMLQVPQPPKLEVLPIPKLSQQYTCCTLVSKLGKVWRMIRT